MKKHITFEKQVIATMISIYCRKQHCKSKNLCKDCYQLYRYSTKRLNRCPFGESKPACQYCKVHCYEKAMRQRVRDVMAFAGPRMLYQHPIMSLKHLCQSKFTKAWSLKEYRQNDG
ncbi:hypothetical protein LNTAR_23284 [Lentisphaera araneosa HTCC2155]|jgi:hypothetical protein|uniref:Nitrous oxide-stimulated promoter family protein n=1 Tax=Lentisphaera araneosa HTCC2155 TaxID=313628 RepID=A6DGP8_9BACT|nr:nitrous oxide-stimulated promoter family protein [Lentisphaera araneosa]EDM29365.1 hypothetical protein LNTAR_23284 [Lentisphaera araneosa HTCC2155]